MHYPGDVDAEQAPGGQEHPPGRPGPRWLPADGSDDPGYGENDPGYGANDPQAGYDAVDDGVAWPDSGSWQDSGYAGDYDSMDTGLAGMPGSAAEGSPYGAASGTARKGPVRGFPPLPGQGPPVYPPGQFAAWNGPLAGTSDSVAAAWPGAASAEHGYGWPAASPGPQLAEPGYSVLAAADPAAGATSTQAWPAAGTDHSAGSWAAPGAAGGTAAGTGQPGTGQASTGQASTGQHSVPAASSADSAALPADSTAVAADAAGAAADAALARSGAAGRGDRGGPGTAPPGTPSRSAARGKRARQHGGRTRLLVSAGLAVVIVAAAVVVWVLRPGHHSPAPSAAAPAVTGNATPPASPGATPDGAGTPSPDPSPSGRWGHIQTRGVDPLPLTVAELFPAKFTIAGEVYTATVTKAAKGCPGAVIGSALQDAIKHASCSQVLRASYLSGDHKIMGTIGVLNLRSARLARHAGGAAGPQEFIAQLKSKKGPTRNLAKGTGIEEADVKGHYLILIWSEFASLHKPKSAAQKAELVQFSNRLLTNTANVSLSRRLVTGKP
jgi:hypothetical protein